MEHPLFEIVTTTTGAVSIRNKDVNEIMHNPVGPWLEANALYIDQSRLRERIARHEDGELVLFDVGLGAAANALAVLHCARGLPFPKRPLHLVSFERDLDLLKFALAHADSFEHFKGYETILETLLCEGRWSEPGLTWELRHGNFTELIEQEPTRAHVVLFDPYSPQVNREMWSTDCFRKVRAKSRDESEGGTLLYTYSQATPIRVALLVAGFYVGQGTATGLKEETTQAATCVKDLPSPLGSRWLERWKRSGAPYPFECAVDQQDQIKTLILEHPQFSESVLRS